MATLYVQFTDDTQTSIRAVFWAPQDPEVWPGIAEMEDDEPRYLAFITPTPPLILTDPLDKLKAFLAANPDVAAILK